MYILHCQFRLTGTIMDNTSVVFGMLDNID